MADQGKSRTTETVVQLQTFSAVRLAKRYGFWPPTAYWKIWPAFHTL